MREGRNGIQVNTEEKGKDHQPGKLVVPMLPARCDGIVKDQARRKGKR